MNKETLPYTSVIHFEKATLHTTGAVRTVDRMVNVFPAARQPLVRSMLSDSLRLVISQQLVPTLMRDGRLMCAEVMVGTSAVSSILRSGKVHLLAGAIQSGYKEGMQSIDSQLLQHVQGGDISGESAYRVAIEKSKFEPYVTRHAS